MNYFNKAEKTLKSCLKEKLSITTATVVGFLIAGTVAFGVTTEMNQDTFDKLEETNYGKQFTTGETTLTNVTADGTKIKHNKYMITVSTGAKLNIDKDSVISTNGTNKYALNITEGSTVINDGKIIFNPNGYSGKVAVQINGGAATKEQPATLTNNGEIIGKNNYLGNTIEMSGNATLNNNGTVIGNITGNDYKGQAGTQIVNLGKGSHIEGTIKLNGTGDNLINIDGVNNENPETVDIQSKDVEVKVNNSNVILTGNIKNENGTAISVNNKDGNNTVINKATIVAETGMQVATANHNNNDSGKENTVVLTNEGEIGATVYGMYHNGYFGHHNKVILDNKNNIVVKGKDNIYGIYAAGNPAILDKDKIVEVSNEGIIEVTSENDNSAYGIRVHEAAKGTNEEKGQIIVNSNNGVGVSVTSENVKSYEINTNFENKGKITVNGEKGIGILAKTKYPNAKGEVKVLNTGNIEANTGIEIQGTEVSVINNGTITSSDFGMTYDGYYYTDMNGNVSITNDSDGKIVVNDDDGNAYGIYLASYKDYRKNGVEQNGEIINKGNIEVTSSAIGNYNTSILGMRVHEHTTGINAGNIVVNAKGASGVAVTGGATYAGNEKVEHTLFNNSGKISVIGDNSVGLLVRHDAYNLNAGNTDTEEMKKSAENLKIFAENEKNGRIIVKGDGVTGVKLSTLVADSVKVPDDEKYNLEFVNNGIIELADGTTNGTGILVEAGTATNNGIIKLGVDETENKAIVNIGGTATNNGIVQVTDNGLDGLTETEALNKLFVGVEETDNKGLIVDKDGNALFAGSEDTTVTGDTTTDVLEGLSGVDGSLTLEGNVNLSAGSLNPEVTTDVLNVIKGTTTIVSRNEVNIEAETINMDKEGKLAVDTDATLGLSNGTLNKAGEGKTAIENNGTLNLTNMDINGNITNSGTMNVKEGESSFDGAITGNGKLVIEENGILNFSSSSSMKKTETRARMAVFPNPIPNLTINGTANVGIGSKVEDGVYVENFFANSNGLVVDGNGKLALDTSVINGEAAKVSLGAGNNFDSFSGSVTTTSGDNGIYVVDKAEDSNGIGTDNIVNITYNKDLYKNTNTIINNMNKEAYAVNSFFSQDVATREKQLDTLYANNIYSETARAAYDMMKLNEESVLSLNADAKVGEWVAAGKALYNKTEYDRTGTVGKYTSETETSGLMAGLEYGLNNTTSVGVAFSGAIQNIDTKGGSADGNVFYLGTYAKKQIGKLSLTAGLGYQYGDYDADNTAVSVSSSASYDVNAYSAYIEGRYGVDLGDNVTLEPKLKLGYTYVDQDNVSDDYFRLSNGELSTFDAEVGADLVKSVALKSGKLDVRFGASYVRAFGDTDDEFTGSFAGSKGSFDVLGAELSEDTAKFDLGVEVSKDNGVFYNLEGTLRVGSDNTRDYGVKLGAGYKF